MQIFFTTYCLCCDNGKKLLYRRKNKEEIYRDKKEKEKKQRERRKGDKREILCGQENEPKDKVATIPHFFQFDRNAVKTYENRNPFSEFI